MATGFASIQRNSVNKDPGYKTLFERVNAATGGEKKSLSWYRGAVKAEAGKYKKNFNKYIMDERKDRVGAAKEQDKNELRRYTVAGHLYMFEYKAKMKWLPYYDRFPLVYVIKAPGKDEFWGANLHYLSPKKRLIVTKKLIQGRVDIPKVCFHKYLSAHVDGLFLDLAADEWDTAILLPTEDYVKNVNGVSFPIDRQVVWEETDEKFYDKITGHRMIKGYGTKQSKEMSQ
ncbi:DNA end protector protein [Synechococcus phage S-WAM2]|uniref:DNA end protector protein n=1 Tax=Synechococcus phage S-WAM2 TaxID=1815522 RepID=A0A1D8KSP8_9CAUD|nr:DNA end protector protein [Synechococcus phage S-WAM2]AOV61700.1 DNA end protector protein [Synechococcus phage S-WAM2]